MVERRVTCPFVGSAVLEGVLRSSGTMDAPVASIDALADLGDSGGGDLGFVLAFFARANHGYVPNPGGARLPLPNGAFSLDFPGSQGSHPGHSGILEGDPTIVASGRFDADAYGRLIARASNGHVSRSAVASFIAENLARDPASTVLGFRALHRLAIRLAAVVGEAAWLGLRSVTGGAGRRGLRGLDAALGRLLGADNLLGSAGEFGLLFALLRRSPRTRPSRGEPAVSVMDLDALFVERRLPAGWDSWRKDTRSWVWNTACIALAGLFAYRRLTRRAAISRA
jgi:hypothetical protein